MDRPGLGRSFNFGERSDEFILKAPATRSSRSRYHPAAAMASATAAGRTSSRLVTTYGANLSQGLVARDSRNFSAFVRVDSVLELRAPRGLSIMFDLDRIQTREQLSGKRCSDLGGKPQCLVYDSLGVHHAILPHRAFSSHTAGPGGGVVQVPGSPAKNPEQLDKRLSASARTRTVTDRRSHVCLTAGVLPRGPERSEGLVGSNDRVLQHSVRCIKRRGPQPGDSILHHGPDLVEPIARTVLRFDPRLSRTSQLSPNSPFACRARCHSGASE